MGSLRRAFIVCLFDDDGTAAQGTIRYVQNVRKIPFQLSRYKRQAEADRQGLDCEFIEWIFELWRTQSQPPPPPLRHTKRVQLSGNRTLFFFFFFFF